MTGRLKELINRGGEKIGPREIDEVLLAHPAVAEAVAFGVPHPSWGEEVAAAVVLKEGSTPPTPESAIMAFCKERLADFKCPKKIYITEAIPRTATGKIQRGAVAQALAGHEDALPDRRRGSHWRLHRRCMARAGEDVTLFARGAHLRAIEEHGLRVIIGRNGDFEVRPNVIGEPDEAGPFDVIFLGVKAHGLTQLAPRFKPLIGDRTTVVSTQNGIPWWF